ncbi:MAG: hypothetical protein CBD16_06825 [Betaproteobacteria bacterium TMED156]|nr:MAG: hypothetical protein CBD16_06825 [Betaproteobacteria bacterium TMED156]|tara:strand:- start:669 stop:947 length:279 start_codon:yes stop_codon:yes gene_type:complete
MRLVFTIFLFVISSLALIDARYNGRVLHTKKEEIQKKHQRVKEEIDIYQITLTELSETTKIKSIAKSDLQMREIKNSDTVYKPETIQSYEKK